MFDYIVQLRTSDVLETSEVVGEVTATNNKDFAELEALRLVSVGNRGHAVWVADFTENEMGRTAITVI